MRPFRKQASLVVSITIASCLFLSACGSSSNDSSTPIAPSAKPENNLTSNTEEMSREVSEVARNFLNTVYKDGDPQSAIPISCGRMKNVLYMYSELSRDEYQSASEITVGKPEVVNSPKIMPSATVEITEKDAGDNQSAFLYLYREDGIWRVCDQTETNRNETGL